MSTARTIAEGGYVDLESPLWPDQGVEPVSTADYAYAPQEEPAAGFDNGINHKITYDHGQLNKGLGDLDARLDAVESDLAQLQSDLDSLEASFGSHNHDTRYYTKTQSDDRFVNISGDTMVGNLSFDETIDTDAFIQAFGHSSTYSQAVQDGNGRVSHYWNVEAGTQNVIAENEGAAWWFMDGGHMHFDLYDGSAGDAGSPPTWSRVLDATTAGVTLTRGATLGGALDANDNLIRGVERVEATPSGDDVMRIDDGSGGSNSTPFTFHYDDRPVQFYSGSTGQSAVRFGTGGETHIDGRVLHVHGTAATVNIGEGVGPHNIAFGNDDSGGGIQLSMRTSPNNLSFEHPGGETIWFTDQDNSAVNFSDSNYVVLPVRGSAPGGSPSGATWIET